MNLLENMNNILTQNGIQEKISLEDLSFGDDTVHTRNREDLQLTSALLTIVDQEFLNKQFIITIKKNWIEPFILMYNLT